MIKAKHTWLGNLVCNLYSGYKLNKAFSTVNIIGNGFDNGLPILMIANHFSWWDGFIQFRLNNDVFKRIFHVMMLEEQLSKHMILNKGGAFSIRKNTRQVLDTLNYTLDLLQEKSNLVLIFPQGKIDSLYTDYYNFESGLYYLLKNLHNEVQIVFNLNLIDYFSDKKPSMYVYYKTYVNPLDKYNLNAIVKEFNLFSDQCKKQQSKL